MGFASLCFFALRLSLVASAYGGLPAALLRPPASSCGLLWPPSVESGITPDWATSDWPGRRRRRSLPGSRPADYCFSAAARAVHVHSFRYTRQWSVHPPGGPPCGGAPAPSCGGLTGVGHSEALPLPSGCRPRRSAQAYHPNVRLPCLSSFPPLKGVTFLVEYRTGPVF